MYNLTARILSFAVFPLLLAVTSTAQINEGEPPIQEPPHGSSSPDGEDEENSDPILLFSGEFVVERQDLFVPGVGLNFEWKRTYRAASGTSSAMGERWDFSYNISVEESGNSLILSTGDGTTRAFPFDVGENQYYRGDLGIGVLGQASTGFTLVFHDQERWFFHGANSPGVVGKVRKIRDRNGNEITFTYAADRLSLITDTVGRQFSVSYNVDGYIESICGPSGRCFQYEHYTSSSTDGLPGDLKSVTVPAVTGTSTGNDFPSGKTWLYRYLTPTPGSALEHCMSSITDPSGATYLENYYEVALDSSEDPYGRVYRQRYGSADYFYSYSTVVPAPVNGDAVRRTIVNDRMGNVEELYYDAGHRLVVRREFTGRALPDQPTTTTGNRPVNPIHSTDPAYFETRNTYSDVTGMRTAVVRPGGLTTSYVYDELNPDVRSRVNLLEVRNDYVHDGQAHSYSDLYAYDDVFNQVVSHTNATGNITSHYLDGYGNPYLTVNPVVTLPDGSSQYSGSYRIRDGRGRVTSVLHPDGRVDSISYHTSGGGVGQVKDIIVDAQNEALSTSLSYDSYGYLSGVQDGEGNQSNRETNALGQLVRIESPAPSSYWTEFYYDASNNLIDVVSERSDPYVVGPSTYVRRSYAYDDLGRLIEQAQDADGAHPSIVGFDYDANGNLSEVTRYEGAAVISELVIDYDERDLIHKQRLIGSSGTIEEVLFARSLAGFLSARTHVDGILEREVLYDHDALGRQRGVTHANGDRVESSFTAVGSLETFVEWELRQGGVMAKVRDATFEYDERGRRVASRVSHMNVSSGVAIGDGEATTTAWHDAQSRQIRVTNDRGGDTYFAYDTAGRLESISDAFGNSSIYGYDNNRNVTSMVEFSQGADGSESRTYAFSYDENNRVRFVTRPTGAVTELNHDSHGNLIYRKASSGAEWFTEFDNLGRPTVTSVKDVGASVAIPSVINHWDEQSRLREKEDGLGNITSYTHDAADRVLGEVRADGSVSSYEYDGFGQLDLYTRHDGVVIDRDYDARGRMTQRIATAGIGGPAIGWASFSYDGLSHVTRAENDATVVEREYDTLGNLVRDGVSIGSGVFQSVIAEYDGLGGVESMTVPSGKFVEYQRDSASRVLSGLIDGSVKFDLEYIGTRLKKIEYANGVAQTHEHSADGMLSSMKLDDDGTVLGRWDSFWTPEGDRSGRTETIASRSHSYDYDVFGRLEAWIGPSKSSAYELDVVGNRLSVTGAGSAPCSMDAAVPGPADRQMNQYSVARGLPLEHDANGNLITICEYHAPSGLITPKHRFSYNERGSIVEHKNELTGVRHEYTYDPFDRRVAKEKFNSSGTSTSRVEFAYLGDALVEQVDVGSSVTVFIGRDSDLDALIMCDTSDWFIHRDDLESVMYVTDSNGLVSDSFDYSDFGVRLDLASQSKAPSSVSDVPFGFAGAYLDNESGSMRFGRRDYIARFGRFAQIDPGGLWFDALGAGVGTQYGNGSPWSFTDRTGYQANSVTDKFTLIVRIDPGMTNHAEVELRSDPGRGRTAGKTFKYAAKAENDASSEYLKRVTTRLEIIDEAFENGDIEPADLEAVKKRAWFVPAEVGPGRDLNEILPGTLEHEFEIDAAGFFAARDFIADWMLNGAPKYHVTKHNCIHFAVMVAIAAGVAVPQRLRLGFGWQTGFRDWLEAGAPPESKGAGSGESSGSSPTVPVSGGGGVLSGKGRKSK